MCKEDKINKTEKKKILSKSLFDLPIFIYFFYHDVHDEYNSNLLVYFVSCFRTNACNGNFFVSRGLILRLMDLFLIGEAIGSS